MSRARETVELDRDPIHSWRPSREATGTGRRGCRLARVHEADSQMAVLDSPACARKMRLSIGPWSNNAAAQAQPANACLNGVFKTFSMRSIGDTLADEFVRSGVRRWTLWLAEFRCGRSNARRARTCFAQFEILLSLLSLTTLAPRLLFLLERCPTRFLRRSGPRT